MKALLFSDLHANYRHLADLEIYCSQCKDIDLLVFAGDVLNGGEPVSFVNTFINAITKIDRPFFWVPGNNDFGRGYHRLNARYPSLEGKIMELTPRLRSGSATTGRVVLTGVGGSPASWSGQYAGESMIDRKSIAGSIFVSHTPPPGILVMNKYDCVSPTDKKLSDSPLVHICGHQHSRWGCGYLGQTKVINPGALGDGRYAIMDTENLAVEFRRF